MEENRDGNLNHNPSFSLPSTKPMAVHYSHKRALHDRRTLTAQENKARAVVAGEKTARNPRFVTTSKGAAVLNEDALTRAKQLVGLKGYVTNIPITAMPGQEVIDAYHDLWNIEQSFRMSKHDLKARPIFHHQAEAIEAHLTIVFTALAIARSSKPPPASASND